MGNSWIAWYAGDYARDTSDLSLLEDAAYRRLLDYYYSTGKPLPANAERLHRVCRAVADAEKAAVQHVVKRYFVRDGDVYRNKRADEELLKQRIISETRSAAAHKSHEKHAQKDAANADANALQMHIQPQPQPQLQPNPQPDKEDCPVVRPKRRTTGPAADSLQATFWIQCTAPTSQDWQCVCKQDDRDGWIAPLAPSKVAEWEAVCPDVDVPRTIAEIRQRIRDTRKYRKTPQGVYRFVGGWLQREQNKP